MKYFYDCEFLEDGKTVDLISIGIVADDGREYYAVNSDAPWDRVRNHQWLMGNVWPHLPLRGHRSGLAYTGQGESKHEVKLLEPGTIDTRDSRVKPGWVIANEVRDFLLSGDTPELWAYYGAYDHVVLCQLWGSMVNLPTGLPMFTRDVMQEASRLGLVDSLPAQEGQEHSALEDARHVKIMHDWLMSRSDTA